jgi:hypothetical protein
VRVERLLLAGIAGLALLLLSLERLPFQDVPNLAQMLTLDRALRAGHASADFRPADVTVVGASLNVWLARTLVRPLPPDAALRALFLLAALGVPLAAAWLARTVGAPAAWAGLLACPLALSWPLRIGLLSYTLGVPLALLFVAAVLDGDSRRTRLHAARGALALVGYAAHPLVLAIMAVAAFVVWWTAYERERSAGLQIGTALAPAALVALIDVARDGMDQLAATRSVWNPPDAVYRGWLDSFVHVLTRSYPIADAHATLFYAPVILATAGCCIVGMRAHGDARRRALLALALTIAAGSVLAPGSLGVAFELGPRLPIVAMALFCVLAADGAAALGARARAAIAATVALALVGTAFEVRDRAAHVQAVVDGGDLRSASGRFLTYRVVDCPEPPVRSLWGRWDELRHVWAYALSVDGATPYLFAFARYHPVWYRDDVYGQMPAPPEWIANGRRGRLDPDACLELDRAWLARALRVEGYRGVVVVGLPARIDPLLAARPDGAAAQRLAPGLVLLTRAAAP